MSSGQAGGSGPPQGGLPSSQYFSLRWNNHPSNLVSVFSGLYSSETLVDVTLAAEGKHIQAHKMLLSACSDYFQSLFSINPCQHPIVILKDVHFEDLQTVVQFMYNGVVNVSSEKLPAVLRTADTLQIKGLGEKFSESMNQYMMSSSHSSSRLLSVPSQHSVNSRQLSTESLPEYLHRARSFSPRQASTDSRQYSMESTVSALVKKHPTPPASPPRHYRKKFRKMSGGESSSDRGNSLEEPTRASPPTIHLSPSRQSSSSTDPEGPIVAKKKRELFSARSSRSGGSNKSSTSEYSREHSFKPLESSGSSGQSHSINQSQEDNNNTLSISTSAGAGATATSTSSLSPSTLTVPTATSGCNRTLSRTQSAGEQSCSSSSSANPPPKRNRFLKRQDCLEKGMDLTTDTVSDSDINIQTIKSSPNSPLASPYACLGSPMAQDSKMLSPLPPPPPQEPHPVHHPTSPSLTKQKSQPILPSEHLLSSFYNIDATPLPPGHVPRAHKLPSVRVIPDASVDPLALEHESPRLMPVPNMRLLCPPDFSERSRMSQLVKSRSTDASTIPTFSERVTRGPVPAATATTTTSAGSNLPFEHPSYGQSPNLSLHHQPSHPHSISDDIDVMPLPSHQVTDQFGHCPKARDGPALGCNYCWNTTDSNGRILRRKTKYHCPECQANLCIVPCFQQYHEALDREKEMSPH